MSLALLGSDSVALVLAGWAAVSIRTLLGNIAPGIPALNSLSLSIYYDPSVYLQQLPILVLFIIGYACLRLYPTVGMNRVEEVRLLSITTTLMTAAYVTILFFSKQGSIYSRFVFGLFWFLSLFLIPMARVVMRNTMARYSMWGVPAGIVGDGPKTAKTEEFLRSHRNLGFRPRLLFTRVDDRPVSDGNLLRISFSLLQDDHAGLILRELDTLVVIQKETPPAILHTLANKPYKSMPRIMVIPDLPGVGSIWVQPVDLGGLLALKIRNNLTNSWHQFQKRAVDLILAGIGSLLTLPLFGLIALAIKLNSPGPIFFVHQRVGKNGRTFPMLKFRTMYVDAEERLRKMLTENPGDKAEWDRYQKLKNDSRVTKVGSILRSFSLDELPQIWNVIRGEMSVVGPRPFCPDQKELYGESYQNYIQVRPGITGMWQISGRNESSFSDRAVLDEYYVRNWSIWMDLYILVRTPIAVFSRDGAY